MVETFGIQRTRYVKIADIASYSAAEMFQIPIDDNTIALWKDILRALRAADIVIDITDDNELRKKLIDRSLHYLTQTDDESFSTGFEDVDAEIAVLKSRMQSFTPHLRHRFASKLGQICKVTERLRSATTAHELAHLTRLEGQLTAHLLTMTAPDEIRESPKFPSYVTWISCLGRFGNVVDTALDLRSDYDSGLTQVHPTFANRSSLLWTARSDLLFLSRHMNLHSLMSFGRSVSEVSSNRSMDLEIRAGLQPIANNGKMPEV